MSSDWHHLLEFIHNNEDSPLALATIVAVEGASYRRPGARLLINSAGEFAGSLSGGCLEEGLVSIAQNVLKDGITRVEEINTLPHFGCPGTLTIQLEKIDTLHKEIRQKVLSRTTFTLTTNDDKTVLGISAGFQELVTPRPRIIVIGWTSDQEPLFQIAHTLGWECVRVVKDSNIRNSLTQITNEQITVCSAEQFPQLFPADSQTAVLIMSHHMVTDLAFLKASIKSSYPYLGLLGSRRRREILLNELGSHGYLEDDSWVERFRAPVGLDLGADHPSTIALSILSEIQSVFANAGGTPLTEKVGTIHQCV